MSNMISNEIMAEIDRLARKSCMANPGRPLFVHYSMYSLVEEEGPPELDATFDLAQASDFSLNHPFFIVWYDGVFSTMRMRICL